MWLNNLIPIVGEDSIDILIEGGKIRSIVKSGDHTSDIPGEPVIEFYNSIVFPGLINSHDHLDFNLFPQLGNRIYNNYIEWGEDIHLHNKDIINSILKIPQALRIQWGIYKNLLNGITTVVNHGQKLDVNDELITIWQKTDSLHSVQLERRWKYKLNNPFINKDWPISIHIGEGTDQSSNQEITQLIKWNLFKRKLIGIHAVVMSEEQAEHFNAIVWCPDSNYFLLGQTAEIARLKSKTQILFGTDSTVSASWSIWEHLRLARKTGMVSDTELLDMLTGSSANIMGIPDSGMVEPGYAADIVIAKRKPRSKSMDAFFALNPEDILMVIYNGNIRLFDEELFAQIRDHGNSLNEFYKIYIGNSVKYVFGNLPGLLEEIKKYKPIKCSIPEYIRW